METSSAVIALMNQMGGPGKSEMARTLAATFAQAGDETLVIDSDPQGHLTESVDRGDDLYLPEEGDPNLFEYLTRDTEPSEEECRQLIHYVEHEKFSLIPSTIDMVMVEQALYLARNREYRMQRLVEKIRHQFTWILIDCSSHLGQLSDNALIAAQQCIIPIHCNKKSVRALDLLLNQIESLQQALNIQVEILAIVPNETQAQNKTQSAILTELRAKIPLVTCFDIPKRQVFEDAWNENRTILSFEPQRSYQAKARVEMVAIYQQLADLIRSKVNRR